MARTKIESELIKLTGVKKKKSEDRQDYFRRLCTAVDEKGDEGWEELSEEAQGWYNQAAVAFKKDEEALDFQEFLDENEEEEEEDEKVAKRAKRKTKTKAKAKAKPQSSDEEEESEEEETPSKKTKTKAKAKAKAKEKKTRTPGAQARAKVLIIHNYDITVDEIVSALQKEGFNPTTAAISSIRAGMRQSIRIMKDEGVLEKAYVKKNF